MNNLSIYRFVATFVFMIGGIVVHSGCGLYGQDAKKVPEIISMSRFDSFLSKDTNLATSLAKVQDLRKISFGKDDIEIRIWRAYTLPTLEGVFFKRVNGEWSGSHLVLNYDQHGAVQSADVRPLKRPSAGWDTFWSSIVDKGLLTFPLTPEGDCDTSSLEGIIYYVEINQNNTYRNYQYHEGVDACRESKQMTEIGEIIGAEFDSGQTQCKTYEWFPCMTDRLSKKR